MVAQVGVERDRITGLSVQRHQDHQQMMYVHRFPLTALLTETPQPIDVVLGEPPSPIPLFLPRIAPHVVAVLLPEAGHVLIDQREAPYPLLGAERDRKSTRLNSSHSQISYAVFCLKKKNLYASDYHTPK